MNIRKFLKKLTTSGAAAALVAGAMLSVPPQLMAHDDTDVFFPIVQTTAQGEINPNILFVLDTSGSMICKKGGKDTTGATCADTQTTSRIDRLKAALTQVLDGLDSNVNVGMERFSYVQGGAILFPVAPIDAYVDDVDLVGASQSKVFSNFVASPDLLGTGDNISEGTETYDGTFTATPDPLPLQNDTITNVNSSTQSVTVNLGTGGDNEAEEYSSGTNGADNDGNGGPVNGGTSRCATGGNNLDIGQVNSTIACSALYSGNINPRQQTIGLRFTGLAVPQGATLESATLTLQVTARPSSNATIRIGVENSLSPAAFTGGPASGTSPVAAPTAANRPSGRSLVSNTTDSWSAGRPSAGSVTTADFSDLLQTLVNNASWNSSSQSVGIILTNSSTSTNNTLTICGGKSSGTSGCVVPKLTVTYHTVTPTHPNPQYFAVRFTDIAIPTGTVITAASVLFHANGAQTGNYPIEVRADKSGNSVSFTANPTISGRTKTTASATWTSGAVADQDDQTTADLSGVVNEIIGNSSWCGGNAITLIFKSTASSNMTRNFISRTGNQNLAPILSLSYAPDDPALSGTTAGCNKTSFVETVAASTDDTFEVHSGSNVNYPTCTLMYLNATPNATPACSISSTLKNTSSYAALRFDTINIPKNAEIQSAFIDFTASTTDNSTVSKLTFTGEAAASPATYASANGTLNTRTANKTSASVDWTSVPAWTVNSTYTSPDLKTIVQELVNRTDWTPNQAVSIFINGSGTGSRAAKTYDANAPSAIPRLRIVIKGLAQRQTVREYLKALTQTLPGDGGTPTMGALYEAAQYFKGNNAVYGRTRGVGDTIDSGEISASGSTFINQRVNHRAAYANNATYNQPAGCSVLTPTAKACQTESWSGSLAYRSPIKNACQSNNLILLSDGEPNSTSTSDGNATPVTRIQNLIGKNCKSVSDSDYKCGTDIVNYMYTTDMDGDGEFDGKQVVSTYTIAFGPDVAGSSAGATFLQSLSDAGGGVNGSQAYKADAADDVVAAFRTIVSSILDKGTTFASPAVTVNTFNRLTNRNELYFALFKPSSRTYWPGNLKRYQLLLQTGDTSPQIYDNSSTPLLAVDPDTGFFKEGTRSFWTASGVTDGKDVEVGGAASRLTLPRKVYTYVGAAPTTTPVDLTTATNAGYIKSGTTDTAFIAKLNLPSGTASDDRDTMLEWARGVDVRDSDNDGLTSDIRTQLGDPLHSEPAIISYGGTAVSPTQEIYYGDNHGFLHAIDQSSGNEDWAYIPQELLSNLWPYYSDSTLHTLRPWGMDGPLTSYVSDPVITGSGSTATLSAPTKAYIYAAMRRGGRNYYGLNVTTKASPKLMFQITGGAGDFAELGQTWSRPLVAKIRWKGATKTVLIFSGGYDNANDAKLLYDDSGNKLPDSMGRGLFVVDYETGALMWWAGASVATTDTKNLKLSDMNWSVAASPVAVDLDADGLIDRIYLVDVGGEVYRFILGKDSGDGNKRSLQKADGTNLVYARKIATLSAAHTSTVAGVTKEDGLNGRRFFNTPDVAMIDDGSRTYITVALGSGFREDPLSTNTKDRFYILRDTNIDNSTTDTLSIAESDLYDATADDVQSADSATRTAALNAVKAAKGFFIDLTTSAGALKGEKALTESSTFNNQVLFATYTPSPPETETHNCEASQGTSRFYQLDILAGGAAQNFDTSSSDLTRSDRSQIIQQAGLPPNPVILFPSIRTSTDGTNTICNGPTCEDGKLVDPVVCTGAVCFPVNSARRVKKAYWQHVEK